MQDHRKHSLSPPIPQTSVCYVGNVYLFQSAESNVSLEGGGGGAYLSL